MITRTVIDIFLIRGGAFARIATVMPIINIDGIIKLTTSSPLLIYIPCITIALRLFRREPEIVLQCLVRNSFSIKIDDEFCFLINCTVRI